MTLLAPIFLAGLLAIGLPLWLHRLSSENPNRRPFSSLMFLEPGEPQRVLAKNLQYLLLLALRIALLVLLVLAFVDPAFWRSPTLASGSGARLHIVVLDTSASMTAGERWDDAVDEARDVIDSLPVADRAQIVAAGRTIELVTGPTLDRAELRQALTTVEPGVFHVNFGQLTRSLEGLLRGAEWPPVLHFVTDAQASGLPTRFAELAPTTPVEIVVHRVGPDTERNWAVESLSGSAVTGELAASLRSFADTDAVKQVSLELNGDVVARETVDLGAGERATVSFPPLTLASGSNRVTAVIEPHDALRADDERILALKRPVPRPVLLVSGDLRGNDTLFVAEALESLQALALRVERVQPADLAERELDEYAFVIVAEASALRASDADRLRDYVAGGGGLLMALGPRSSSLSAVPVTGQSFAATAAALGARAEYALVGTMDTSHPILRGLDTLRAARFTRSARIEPGADDRVLVRLDNGAPLLVERALGAGRVLLFTSSLNRDWNDLAVQPVFVPFMAGVANHLLGGAGFSNEAALGSTLALRAMGMQGGQIFDPAGEPVLGLGGGTDDVLLDRVGFYELVGGGRTEVVAVNFDTRESALAAADADTLERWQALGRRPEAAGAAAAAGQAAEPILEPVGWWALLLLLVVVVMESWIGNWHLRVRRGMAA